MYELWPIHYTSEAFRQLGRASETRRHAARHLRRTVTVAACPLLLFNALQRVQPSRLALPRRVLSPEHLGTRRHRPIRSSRYSSPPTAATALLAQPVPLPLSVTPRHTQAFSSALSMPQL